MKRFNFLKYFLILEPLLHEILTYSLGLACLPFALQEDLEEDNGQVKVFFTLKGVLPYTYDIKFYYHSDTTKPHDCFLINFPVNGASEFLFSRPPEKIPLIITALIEGPLPKKKDSIAQKEAVFYPLQNFKSSHFNKRVDFIVDLATFFTKKSNIPPISLPFSSAPQSLHLIPSQAPNSNSNTSKEC